MRIVYIGPSRSVMGDRMMILILLFVVKLMDPSSYIVDQIFLRCCMYMVNTKYAQVV